jgi:hypothetical protein
MQPDSSQTTQSRSHGPDRPSTARRTAGLAGAVTILMLAIVSSAAAATKPGVSTGAAKDVGFASAVLTGTVNPNGANTSYYFQYGLTKAYGGQTAIADAGSGSKGVAVKLPITGLQPITVYHYRLVAVNASGASIGSDHTLLTTKVPLSLQILASPNPAIFGGPIVVQGTLLGTNNGGRQVVLQGNQFPFTAGFLNVGNPELTTAAGGFSFNLLGAALITQYRVVTVTKPAIVSPIVTENVAVKVTSHIAKTKRKGFARIYGTVTPAENGAQVGMLRIVGGRGVLAGGTILKANGTTASSSFSRIVHVHKGVYRVLIRVLGAGQVSNYGAPLVIR